MLPALMLVGALWLRRGKAKDFDLPWFVVGSLWIYICTFPWFPPLLRALCLGCVLAGLLSRLYWHRTLVSGVWGSLLLALPMLPSMQFFLGYPWRRWTTLAAAKLLGWSGFAVTAEGAQLRWSGGLVAVDAPCSGLYMGWVVGVLLIALWLFSESSWRTSLLTGSIALGLVLVANGLRASALFFLESGVLTHPPFALRAWHHDAVGLVIFAPVCLLLAWMVARARPQIEVLDASSPPGDAPRANKGRTMLWYIGLLVAFCLPWTVDSLPQPSPTADAFPGWPSSFEGRPLQQLPLTDREERFGEGFPGRLGRFHDGQREVLLRWVEQPTRRLHAAAQCLHAHGYVIDHQPLELDTSGRPWSVFLAREDVTQLRVREGIRDADGQQWGDVSAWYWAAVLGRSRGPWWGFVVAERFDSDRQARLSP